MWRRDRGLIYGVNSDPDFDANDDSKINLLHFAFDTDPLGDGSDEGKSRVLYGDDRIASKLSFTFPVRINAAEIDFNTNFDYVIDGIRYCVRGSSNLEAPFDDRLVFDSTPVLSNGLPSLSPGYEYRTCYLRQTVSLVELPRGYIRIGVKELE